MTAVKTIAAHWWVVLIRGIIAILFGITALAFPGLTAIVFVFLFAGYAVAEGILNLVTAFRFAEPSSGRWWWMIVQGILGIGIGVVTVLWPHITALALGILVAVWAIATGIMEIAAGIRMRKDIPNEIFLIVVGVLSIIVGIILSFEPLTALVAWVWVVAFYAILAGVALIALAFRLRGMHGKLNATAA